MQSTSSVSQVDFCVVDLGALSHSATIQFKTKCLGSFLFLPKGFSLSKIRKGKKRKHDEKTMDIWEKTFNRVWKIIDDEVKDVNEELFKKVLAGLLKHIKTLHNDVKMDEGVLPCEILLTGTNLPDHNLLISALTDNIKKEVTPYISILWSRNCGNIKSMVTSFVQQILQVGSKSDDNLNDDDNDDESEEGLSEDDITDEASSVKLQSSQYSLSTLCAWYSLSVKNHDRNQPVVIFIPDFESFSSPLLSEFILLLSSYSSHVPLILVFGVATTPGVVYQSLPRNVLSQLIIQLFKSEPSISFLNQIVEKIFFSEKCPFRIGSKCMTFLTDVFLFHSFSVQGFVQGFKFCMMEHFYKKNHISLCCNLDEIEKEGNKLSNDDLLNLRKIKSFQNYVEESSKENRKLLLLDNDHTRKAVIGMVQDIQEHLRNFQVALKCLHILTHDLPQSPLGRHVREYYCKAISDDITKSSEYKECLKLLHLQSRSELTQKVSLIVDLLKLNSLFDILASDKHNKFDEVSTRLEEYKKKFDKISLNGNLTDGENGPNDFEAVRKSLLDYIESELIEAMLKPVVMFPLHEIILFDDLQAVRRRISGSPRGAIHLALNNPQYYLDCKCCKLPHAEAVLPTLPDLSVAYKLHLEFGKVINLVDWLQAFAACIKPDWEETKAEIDEEVQARFTRAVSELQFLGFIKPSRSKAEHVLRLTWGSF